MSQRRTVTARITVERISAGEIRVTLTADIRIGGDVRSLIYLHDGPAGAGDPGGQGTDAALRQEFLTVDQAAEVLHVSRDAIYDLIRTGQLRSIKIGRLRRISRQWIAEFIGQQGHDKHNELAAGDNGRTAPAGSKARAVTARPGP
jgi:excisionase family DNA binding protein